MHNRDNVDSGLAEAVGSEEAMQVPALTRGLVTIA